jgi:RNA polymerase sigma factor (sigma-70 family)
MLLLIQGCKRHDRESQRLLYQHYYGYAYSICVRYCRTRDEAKEVVNDGFMKVFQKIDQYNQETSFKGWLRRIMVNTSIDLLRKEHHHHQLSSLEVASDLTPAHSTIISDLSHTELIAIVQQLSPSYRAVFNLYVIDGFTHKEISRIMGIAEGTSKSNLLKAREKLRNVLSKLKAIDYAKSV